MPISAEEQQLISDCLAGNARSQYALYHRYVTAMYNTAIRLVVQPADAEDVLQDGFQKVFQQLHTFRQQSTLGAWIRRIVVNTALGSLRDKRRLQFNAWDDSEDIADDPDVSFGEQWTAADLHRAVKSLPDGCRVVFTLFAIEDQGHQDIANLLGISESTSKTQYRRARQLLKIRLLNQKQTEIP